MARRSHTRPVVPRATRPPATRQGGHQVGLDRRVKLIQDHTTAESDFLTRCMNVHDMERPLSVVPLCPTGARHRSSGACDKASFNSFVPLSIEADGRYRPEVPSSDPRHPSACEPAHQDRSDEDVGKPRPRVTPSEVVIRAVPREAGHGDDHQCSRKPEQVAAAHSAPGGAEEAHGPEDQKDKVIPASEKLEVGHGAEAGPHPPWARSR